MNKPMPIPATKRTTTRTPTNKELSLTKADLEFKQAVLTDVEAQVRLILPTLVRELIHEEIGEFINDVIATVNSHDTALMQANQLANTHDTALAAIIKEVFPHVQPDTPTETDSADTTGATDDVHSGDPDAVDRPADPVD